MSVCVCAGVHTDDSCTLTVICIISLMVASVDVRLQWSVWMFTVRWLLMRLSALTVVTLELSVALCSVL